MQNPNAAVAIFKDHASAESAVKQLGIAGFDLKSLSVVGRGYHVEEQVAGFYNMDDRIKFWGGRGAFWGGLWGLFFGGVFLTLPLIGPVVVLGYLATALVSVIEGAVVVGGMSALAAAIYGLGIPKDSVLQYQTDIEADNFLVMVHGTHDAVKLARQVLVDAKAARVDIHGELNEPQRAAAAA